MLKGSQIASVKKKPKSFSEGKFITSCKDLITAIALCLICKQSEFSFAINTINFFLVRKREIEM